MTSSSADAWTRTAICPGRFDVTMNGRDMRLRFPEGMRSLVDADLTLQGTRESAVLSGLVAVKDAVYTQSFNATGSLFDFGGETALAPAAAAAAETLPVRLDIRINAPSTLQVQNRTLRLVANADLQLRGTIERPVLLGQRRDRSRRSALRRQALPDYARDRGLQQPDAHRAVSRHRGGDTHSRAAGNLSHHAAGHRSLDRHAELQLRFGSAAR